jgi:ABC-type multidrug transport system ATPase subunit
MVKLVALDGAIAKNEDHTIDHLYEKCKVAYCPQFDALFPKKTVEEHLRFYARIRGLDGNESNTAENISAIIKLLGLEKHRQKESRLWMVRLILTTSAPSVFACQGGKVNFYS